MFAQKPVRPIALSGRKVALSSVGGSGNLAGGSASYRCEKEE